MQLTQARKVDQRGLMGFGDAFQDMADAAAAARNAPAIQAARQNNLKIACANGGGSWVPMIDWTGNDNGYCSHPSAAPAPVSSPAIVSVTVPTQVTSTVSPQVSPVMQQSSGSGSLTAGTQQAGSAGLTASDLQKILDQQRVAQEQQTAAQLQAQQLEIQKSQADALAAQQAAYLKAQQDAAAQAAQAAQGGSFSASYPTGMTVATAPDQTATVASSPEPQYSMTMILLTAAGVIAAFLALDSGKGKRQ